MNGWLGAPSFRVINKTQRWYRSTTQAGGSAPADPLCCLWIYIQPPPAFSRMDLVAKLRALPRLWLIAPVRPAEETDVRERDVFTVYEKGGGPEPEGDASSPQFPRPTRRRLALSGADRCQRHGEVSLPVKPSTGGSGWHSVRTSNNFLWLPAHSSSCVRRLRKKLPNLPWLGRCLHGDC